ncbi:MAG: hypothetical protein ABRQ26_08900 [Syntrophomonadaceae bacterium]
MDSKNLLQTCISQFKDARLDIQTVSQTVHDTQVRDELSKALRSVESAISQCQSALNMF